MPVTLSSSVALLGPTKCKRPRLARRTAIIATVAGAGALSAKSDNLADLARSYSLAREKEFSSSFNRLMMAVHDPASFNVKFWLAMTSLDFVDHLAEISQQLRQQQDVRFHLPQCLQHGAGYQVQPYYWASEPSRYVGAVFGLLGAKTVCDIRHQPLTMLHKRRTETTSCKTAPGSDLPPECQTLYRPWRQSLDQVDCAFHIVCAGAACLMPTHPWYKAAALCGGVLTAYLFGPHFISGKLVAPEGQPFHIDGFSQPQPFYEYIGDRPPLPWLAFPPDPVFSELASSQTPSEPMLSILDLDKFKDCVGKSD